MKFKLHLYSDEKKDLEESRKKLKEEIREFTIKEMRNYTSTGKFEQKRALTVEDLNLGAFWRVLTRTDGLNPNNHPQMNPEELQAHNQIAREWSQKTYHHLDLEGLLNMVVNTAILKPYGTNTGMPGTDKGHTILYEALVEKEDSMFKEVVTEDFQKRLNNGRFWESLGRASTVYSGNHDSHLHDVLINHYSDLDVSFAHKGVDLMKEANKDEPLNMYLHHLGEEGLERYVGFVDKIDKIRYLTPSRIKELLTPYLHTILSWDVDYDVPYYSGFKDCNGIRGKFQDKLQTPIIQKYIQKENIQKVVGETLAYNIRNQINSDGIVSNYIDQVLNNIPEPREIMMKTLDNLKSYSALIFFRESEKAGYDFSSLVYSKDLITMKP